MANILLVDDDIELATVIARWLKKEGHEVTHVLNGRAGEEYLHFSTFDLMILDWMMPEMTGQELLVKHRATGGTTPVIMLTGKREIEDKEIGFSSGADDYLTKPFNGRELILRVNALLRRSNNVIDDSLVFSHLKLDRKTRNAEIDGKQISLTVKEFALLEFLIRRKQQFIPTESIMASIWQGEESVGTEALMTCISRLRQKIDKEKGRSLIRNSHGLGYGIFKLSD